MTDRPNNRHPGAAFITGGSQRIGQSLALALAKEGYDIALHYNHSRAEAQNTAQKISRTGVKCEIFYCNLSDEREILALIKRVRSKFPKLNILVNNASIFKFSGFEPDLPLFNEHFAVNLRAPYILMCEFARFCKKGQIINLLDASLVRNKTAHVAYLLTKKSLADLTQMAALEFAPNIRVNGICPGFILPAKGGKTTRSIENIPLKRKGGVENIVQSLKFLIENDYMTGQFLFNDGGEHLNDPS